jgi:superfamily II DNA or RNA helicase
VKVKFDEGTLLLEDLPNGVEPPDAEWDDRVDRYRTQAHNYTSLLGWLESSDEIDKIKDEVKNYTPLSLTPELEIEPRDYQREALSSWKENQRRGTVVLPTGSGKTYLGVQAIVDSGVTTLVVVPTIDLMNQWYSTLKNAFGEQVEIGVLGGGEHDIKPITVSTYDSGYLYIDSYGDRFGLLVFDEVHHCAAPTHQHIPEMSIAPYRLGLTATYERADQKHLQLRDLIGEKVYEEKPEGLTGEYLSEYETIRMKVELTDEERQKYDEEYSIYRDYIDSEDLELWKDEGYQEFLKRTAKDTRARRALIAKNRSESIARTAEKKLDTLDTLIKRHHDDRVIIFTANNEFAYEISREFIIPCITHQTETDERTEILDRFKSGEYSMLVTSKVLDEGVNVPAAKVGIILSGSASKRQYVQRLGRILRKTEDNEPARLYEIIASNTKEKHVSQRRRKGVEN